LAGRCGIHRSYIQEMLADCRYSEEDILAVIEYLKVDGERSLVLVLLNLRIISILGNLGDWVPADVMNDKDVLIIASRPSVDKHHSAIESYNKTYRPFIISFNTQKIIDDTLINVREACHPVRLLADCHEHLKLPQPLVTPASMLPEDVKQGLSHKELLDFGVTVKQDVFEFHNFDCILPASLVLAYALAIATSGHANHILVVGLDGYGAYDLRDREMELMLKEYKQTKNSLDIMSLLPTRYELDVQSIYAFEEKR